MTTGEVTKSLKLESGDPNILDISCKPFKLVELKSEWRNTSKGPLMIYVLEGLLVTGH